MFKDVILFDWHVDWSYWKFSKKQEYGSIKQDKYYIWRDTFWDIGPLHIMFRKDLTLPDFP